MEKVLVKAKDLGKIYKTKAQDIIALKKVDFTINQGEFVSVLGPSGAGKTTLLNLIGCLDGVSSGSLEVMGYEINQGSERKLTKIRSGNIGFVFQEFFLIPTLSALENVELPLIFSKSKKDSPTSKELLEKVGLEKRLSHLPKELSGGEMQRVAIARALATGPNIILADEPTGNLDTKNAKSIFSLFRQICEKKESSVVVATHNVGLAYLADKIIHLKSGVIEKEEILGA